MDGRITHAPTPHARIAAVCRSIILKYAHPAPDRPDYADLSEWLEIYLERELLLRQVLEGNTEQTPEHKNDLRDRLIKVEAVIAENKL